jgi:riboflavin synthase
VFTGIVQATGQIVSVTPLEQGCRLRIEAPTLGLDDVAIGDSIALNGACMTVTTRDASGFTVDVSAESLAKTSRLDRPGPVNLEKALRLGDRLDGHMVSGHVDGTGVVRLLEPAGESWTLEVEVPGELSPYFAYKGSVTLDGVSLTVNAVDDTVRDGRVTATRLRINLIPHTVAATTLGQRRAGDLVNVEVDTIARHVARLLAMPGGPAGANR